MEARWRSSPLDKPSGLSRRTSLESEGNSHLLGRVRERSREKAESGVLTEEMSPRWDASKVGRVRCESKQSHDYTRGVDLRWSWRGTALDGAELPVTCSLPARRYAPSSLLLSSFPSSLRSSDLLLDGEPREPDDFMDILYRSYPSCLLYTSVGFPSPLYPASFRSFVSFPADI